MHADVRGLSKKGSISVRELFEEVKTVVAPSIDEKEAHGSVSSVQIVGICGCEFEFDWGSSLDIDVGRRVDGNVITFGWV
jgi:hypothetical protein